MGIRLDPLIAEAEDGGRAAHDSSSRRKSLLSFRALSTRACYTPKTTIHAMVKPRILVVDDEEPIRKTLRMTLEYEGYDVLEAASGSEALDQIEHEPPELVFLDIKMPGMDGLEVLEEVRERDHRPAGRDDQRARQRRDRGAGDEARRLRFHREAARDRAGAARGAKRARAQTSSRRRSGGCRVRFEQPLPDGRHLGRDRSASETRSPAPRRRTPRCSSPASRVPARSSSPAPSTATATAHADPSSRSTAPPSRRS